MKFYYNNRKSIDKIYIHDSRFEGLYYDYEKRQVTLAASEHYYIKKRFHFKFENVIFFSMQSCSFWGGGYRILDMHISEENLQMKQLIEIQSSKPDEHHGFRLDQNIDYIPVEFQINSGDVLLIICEALDLIEEDLS